MNMITLRSFDNYFLANITLTKLQDAGVECYLKDENTVTIDPILSNAIGGIKLVVKEADAADAKQLLQQFDEEYLKSVKCPKCSATEITLVTKPGASNYITAIFTWLFSSYAVAAESIYQCSKCGYESKTMPDTINEEDLHE
jgi:DNA-directed RNA polymerase subunit M/transcription elongation factor TFIIS